MGKVLSSFKRIVYNFDLEDRAIRCLEKNKQVNKAAPKHSGTITMVDERYDELLSHNPTLDANINALKVKEKTLTKGILPDGVEYVHKSTRKLPQKILFFDPYPRLPKDFGFIVPDSVPEGRITMRQAVELIKAYQTGVRSVDNLSESYHLDKDNIENIVNYFSLFAVSSGRLWVPSSLISPKEQYLLDEPVSNMSNDEMIGESAYHQRKQTLEGVKLR
ncbi:unnamed protein product [Heterobilharzia americana]|nr:unnamed protein product [Heterobilharzia americana]